MSEKTQRARDVEEALDHLCNGLGTVLAGLDDDTPETKVKRAALLGRLFACAQMTRQLFALDDAEYDARCRAYEARQQATAKGVWGSIKDRITRGER